MLLLTPLIVTRTAGLVPAHLVISLPIFVAAETGKITAVRNGTWRLYDFFWSLHIMDWKNHENFNSWWLLTFAIGGLALGVAGTILLFMRWPFRRARRNA